MTRIIFLILSNIIIISCNISYDDGIVVWYESNEKTKVCFVNLNKFKNEQCQESKYKNLPDNGIYKKLKKRRIGWNDIYKERRNLSEEASKKVQSCDSRYRLSRPLYNENNERIISSVNSNLYVEYIYPAYHIDLKEKLYAPEGNVNLKENILCGYNYGKCEVIFKDNFEEYLSTSEGRYILINRRLNKNKFSILSIDPINKITKNILINKLNVYFFRLNSKQSIIEVNGKEIYIFDHNKNTAYLIDQIPDNIINAIFQKFENSVVSVKNKYIIFSFELKDEHIPKLLILDFNNKIKPIIKILPVGSEWDNIMNIESFEEPFYYTTFH